MDVSSGPFTIAIIAVTALVSAGGFSSIPFREKYLFEPGAILNRREYHRLITSGFLHADWGHLFVNMFSFYSFGGPIEKIFGFPTLLVIYFSSILGGNLLSLLLHRKGPYRALGASGGVCGIVYAAIFLMPGGSVYVFPVPVPIPSYIYAILFVLISFFGIRGQWGNIGHDAHLGGAIIGLLVTTLFYPGIVAESFLLWAAVMGLSLALFFWLYRSSRASAPRLRTVRSQSGERRRRPWQ